MVATLFTLTYSLRLVGVVFMGVGGKKNYFIGEEFGMILPMGMLLMLSVFAGCWFNFFLMPQGMVYIGIIYKIFLIVSMIFVVFVGLVKLSEIKKCMSMNRRQ